jgi:hypothetical protein
MPTIAEIIPEKISLDIESVDRVYLNGYIPNLQMGGGVVNFIREQMKWPIPSPKAMYEMTAQFKQAVEAYAEAMGREIYTFSKGEEKDQVAREHAELFGIKEGVVLIGKAQEKSNAFRSQTERKGNRVWFKYERRNVQVTHYYFYLMDKDFGLSFIKVCTYLPFEVKVCLNGHEWAKQQLRQADVGFEALSNGFASCEAPAVLQAICHQLNAEKLQRSITLATHSRTTGGGVSTPFEHLADGSLSNAGVYRCGTRACLDGNADSRESRFRPSRPRESAL